MYDLWLKYPFLFISLEIFFWEKNPPKNQITCGDKVIG